MMTSTRPYLIRAFYEWIVDNDCTPHIVVNADVLGTDVPREYIDGGQIVLNISMTAVQSLSLGNELINFQARFNGIARMVSIPIRAIMAIYARENGRGMVFTEEEGESSQPPAEEETTTKGGDGDKGKGKGSKRPGKPSHLTVVK
jgi:stringent starvation protein B